MRITTIGKGNIGGGLATLWEGVGHHVTRLGREGGSLSARGTRSILAGAHWPRCPFYFGLYGGSNMPGFLDSDAATGPFRQKYPLNLAPLSHLDRGYAPVTLAYNLLYNQPDSPWIAMFRRATGFDLIRRNRRSKNGIGKWTMTARAAYHPHPSRVRFR